MFARIFQRNLKYQFDNCHIYYSTRSNCILQFAFPLFEHEYLSTLKKT